MSHTAPPPARRGDVSGARRLLQRRSLVRLGSKGGPAPQNPYPCSALCYSRLDFGDRGLLHPRQGVHL